MQMSINDFFLQKRGKKQSHVFPYENDDCDIRTNDGQLFNNDISFFRRFGT